MLIHKSRLKWCNDRENNSKFFHSMVRGRNRRNFIGNLETERRVVDFVTKVNKEFWRHFREKFLEPDLSRANLDGIDSSYLFEEEMLRLEVSFSDFKIKDVFWGVMVLRVWVWMDTISCLLGIVGSS